MTDYSTMFRLDGKRALLIARAGSAARSRSHWPRTART